jgi:multiple sugar transport system substrate-binding protein
MRIKPARALIALLTIPIIFFLSSCQGPEEVPVITVQSTDSAETPTGIERATQEIKESTASPQPSPTVSPGLNVDLEQLRGQEVVFWHPWSGDSAKQVDALVKDFNLSNEWGIFVKPQSLYSAGALYDALQTGLEGEPDRLPDIIAAPSEQLADLANQQDILVPLDDYLSQPENGLDRNEMGSAESIFWNQDRLNGQQFGVPFIRTAHVLFYNQTWARELGFESPPVSPLELKEQACAAARVNNSSKMLDRFGTGGWLVDTSPMTMISWLEAFGSNIRLDEQENPSYHFETENGKAAVSFLRALLDDGCAWISRNNNQYENFARRKALFYSGNLQDIYNQRRINQINGTADEWTILPYTRLDGSKFVYTGGYSLALPEKEGIEPASAGSIKKMAAWMFLRWLAQPENKAKFTESIPSLPMSAAEQNLASSDQFLWDAILPLKETVLPAPSSGAWRTVRRLVEDASWQIYHLPANQVPFILPQLDEAVKEAVGTR